MPDVLETVAAIIERHADADGCQQQWPTLAAAAVLAHLRGLVVPRLAALEHEQTRLAANRSCIGLGAQAREHALRARAHGRDKDTVRDLLEPDHPAAPVELEAAAWAAIEHLRVLAAHVPGTGRAALDISRWVKARSQP